MKKVALLLLVVLAIFAAITVVMFTRTPQGEQGVVEVTPEKTPAAAESTNGPDRVNAPVDVAAREAATEEPAPEESTEIEEPTTGNARVVGVVLNPAGAAVEGATVKISLDALMGESIAMDWFSNRESSGKFLTTTTDAKGAYVFRGVDPARSYYVMASHPEYASVQEEGLRVPKTGEVRAPDLVLSQGSVFKGYVSDFQGGPLPNAVVDVDSAYMMGIEMASPDRLTVKTDAQGYYEFRNISAGPRIVSAWADGFERQIHHDVMFAGTPGEVVERSFTLNLGHPIAGRVFGPGNEGIAGAKVYAINYGSNVSSRGDVLTDENGNFQIDGLAMSSFILMVQAKGYRMARQTRVAADDLNVQIEMIKQGAIPGRVVDATTNQPIRDFKVSLLHVNTAVPIQGSAPVSYEPTEVRETVKGSEDGSFTLVGVDPGNFAIKVTASGYASKVSDTFSVVDGAQQPPVTIQLSKGGTIKGRLVDGAAGKGISGATVTSRDGDLPEAMAMDPFLENMVASRTTERKVRTGADGLFEIKLLNPGRYRLQLEHPEYASGWAADIVVVEGATNDIGQVQLYAGGSVQGKVVDATGKPGQRCVVHLFSMAAQDQYTARTDAEGRYEFTHVRPGDYRMTASRSSGAAGDAINQIVEQAQSEVQVRVGEGQITNRDISIGN
jgi:uncharacterized GH25 family protein